VTGQGADEMEQDKLLLYQKLGFEVRLLIDKVLLYTILGLIHWWFLCGRVAVTKAVPIVIYNPNCHCYQTRATKPELL
jgi:hypothetical protein